MMDRKEACVVLSERIGELILDYDLSPRQAEVVILTRMGLTTTHIAMLISDIHGTEYPTSAVSEARRLAQRKIAIAEGRT